MQDDGERKLGFSERKLPADARAPAVTERFVRVTRKLRFRRRQEALDVERFGIWPHHRIPVQRRNHDRNGLILLDEVTSTDARVLVRRHGKRRRRRPQPQRFFEDALDYVQLGQVREGRHRVSRQDAVDLGVCPGQHVWIP